MQPSVRACSRTCASMRPCMCSPSLRRCTAKSCLAAYTAAPVAHLLHRPRVSLAYSVLMQAEQSEDESMPGRQVGISAVYTATPSRP